MSENKIEQSLDCVNTDKDSKGTGQSYLAYDPEYEWRLYDFLLSKSLSSNGFEIFAIFSCLTKLLAVSSVLYSYRQLHRMNHPRDFRRVTLTVNHEGDIVSRRVETNLRSLSTVGLFLAVAFANMIDPIAHLRFFTRFVKYNHESEKSNFFSYKNIHRSQISEILKDDETMKSHHFTHFLEKYYRIYMISTLMSLYIISKSRYQMSTKLIILHSCCFGILNAIATIRLFKAHIYNKFSLKK